MSPETPPGPLPGVPLPGVTARALIDTTSDLYITVGPDARITGAAARIDRLWRGPLADLVGREALSVLHPDDRELAASELAAFMFGGEPISGDAEFLGRIIGADGVARWAAIQAGELEPPAEGIVVIARDAHELVSGQPGDAGEARLRALIEHAPSVVEVLDAQGVILWAGPGAEQARGVPRGELVGTSSARFTHPDDADEANAWFRAVAARPGASDRYFGRMIRGDGQVAWVDATITNRLDDPAVRGIVANFHDVTDLVRSRRVSDRLGRVVERTTDLVLVIDPDSGLPVEANPAARSFWGIPPDGDLATVHWGSALTPQAFDIAASEVIPVASERGTWTGELDAVSASGRAVTMSVHVERHTESDGAYAVVARDISERKAFEARLAHEATHDPLTGLPNRALLVDRLEHALARAARSDQQLAVIFCDLDHFKVINDSLGHGAGDVVLRAVAERLVASVRPGDTVARFGGDELVVVCEDLDDPGLAASIADRIGPAIAEPIHVAGAEVFVTVSCGVALSRPGSTIAEEILGDADAAMYRAKATGRARVARFDRSMRDEAVARLDLEGSLRRALDRHEIRVHYQPIVDVASGAIVAVEALARWEHPERGLLAPGEWIGLAEDTGLIVPIGGWILDQACRQVQRGQATLPGLGELEVSVNVSGRQLGQVSFVAEVERVLAVTGLAPSRLGIELTESLLMDDVDRSAATLGALKDLGVQVVVDDFGTGYSSLSYLRRFPVDQLKVDRSFVDGLGTDADDTAIAALIVALARTLGLRSVAEGVETEVQLAEVRRLGVDRAQGYLLGRPQPPERLGDVLAELTTPNERSAPAPPPSAR
ncbi:MAG TPA: EAL domain-containing protein [Acidimicrobiales bacterium]|nr:EAL domain-containing protein [Acidimicrobiales bacterium]